MKTTVILATILSMLIIVSFSKAEIRENVSISKLEEIELSENLLPESLKVTINSTNSYVVSDATKRDFIEAQKVYKNNLITDTLKYLKNNGCFKLPISNTLEPGISYCDNSNDNNTEIEGLIYIDGLYYTEIDGEYIHIEGDFGNTDFIEYKYLGHFPTIKHYLVKCRDYESLWYDLIDMNSGEKIQPNNIPMISPKGQYIVNIVQSSGYADLTFGFDIYKFDEKSQLITEVEGIRLKPEEETWYPIDFVWYSDKSLIIKVISQKSEDYINYNYENPKHAIYKKVEFR